LRFLEAMRRTIRDLHDCMIVEAPHSEGADEDSCLLEDVIPAIIDDVCVEFKRLLEHPELFPAGSREWYPKVMEYELRQVLDHIGLQYFMDEDERLDYPELALAFGKKISPGYDENRTTWQQFLHSQAPGSGIPKEWIVPWGCTQMITYACGLVVANKSREHQGYMRSLEDARGKPLNRPTVYKSCPTSGTGQILMECSMLLTGKFLIKDIGVNSSNSSLAIVIFVGEAMAINIKKLFNAMRPDQLDVVQSIATTRDLSIIMNGPPKPLTMAKAHGYGGIVKGKKGSVSVKIGFYAILFDEFQQKVISTYIVFLWESDPFKAKWALVAKAYSVIRNEVGKEHAPLDTFLLLVAEFVGIIEPQNYLALMGWEVSVDAFGTVSLVKNDTGGIDSNMLSTNVSVEDIITYAGQQGYAGMTSSIVARHSDQANMVMAASAQPLAPQSSQGTASSTHQANNATTVPASSLSSGTMPVTSSHPVQNVAATGPQINTAPNAGQAVTASGTSTTTASNANDAANPFAFDSILDWDPEADVLTFDPYDGDPFDAFDISAWIHPDAYTT
ncbi:MAG: hypothetical protein Q9181_007703, partial [Wetmoreana brouardii]